MKKRLKLLGLALGVVALMALTLGSTVFADTSEETDVQTCGAGWGGWQGGATCSETVGDLLGLTHEEIEAQRHEGKSMVEIAAAQVVTEERLRDKVSVRTEDDKATFVSLMTDLNKVWVGLRDNMIKLTEEDENDG